jgi:CheY-like chemotaxis protein
VKRILIVDDLLSERTLAGSLLLRESKWEVDYANNGRAALEQIEQRRPDLIVTDLQMPEMDGLELVSAVRERFPLIPVILMTARGSEEIAVQALQRGAASYVPKRALPETLVENVTQVLASMEERLDEQRLTASLSELGYVLENDSKLMSTLVSRLRQLVQERELFDETESLRLATALSEALENAHYHGNLEVSSTLREESLGTYFDLARTRRQEPPYMDRRVYVKATFFPHEVILVIRDDGPGFDQSCLPDPTDLSWLERPHGRGILLMRTFVDEVKFNEKGNEVALIKRRIPTPDP